MSLSFYGKRPGPGMRLDKLSMQFSMHETDWAGAALEAYERLIYDAARATDPVHPGRGHRAALGDQPAAPRQPAAGAALPTGHVGPEPDPPADRAVRLAAAVRAARGATPTPWVRDTRGDEAVCRWARSRSRAPLLLYRRLMEKFSDADLSGSQFEHVRLKDSRFDQVDLTGATFRSVGVLDAEFVGTAFHRVRMRGVELCDVEISGEILRLTVNGVDVGPLVEAELDRRDPERAKLRPTDPAGFREAWDLNERRWQATVDRAGGCHRGCSTSRSTTSGRSSRRCGTWPSRRTAGSVVPSSATPRRGTRSSCRGTRCRTRRASLVTDRLGRRSTRRWSCARPDGRRSSLPGRADRRGPGGGHHARRGTGLAGADSYPVRECLLTVLSEEYYHRLFAERDLAVLEARRADAS